MKYPNDYLKKSLAVTD